ncbi:MAG: preprotein translocase subunit SecG [Clostridia bacterium]|nr:preprotein translocase subunit SecG [Clostridia bacterium]
MFNLSNLLAPTEFTALYFALCITITIIILLLSIVSIVFVLMQPSNSDGINSITGSSETFFGKNKGKSIESRLKKWTTISLIIIGVLSIVYFILQIASIWG